MIIKMLTYVKRAMHEQSQDFNKKKENVKRKKTPYIIEVKNTIIELKNSGGVQQEKKEESNNIRYEREDITMDFSETRKDHEELL